MHDRHISKLKSGCRNYLLRNDRDEIARKWMKALRDLEKAQHDLNHSNTVNYIKQQKIEELTIKNEELEKEKKDALKEKENTLMLLNIKNNELQILNEKKNYYKNLATPNIELEKQLNAIIPENDKLNAEHSELKFKYFNIELKNKKFLSELVETKNKIFGLTQLYETEKNKKCQNCEDYGLPLTAHTEMVKTATELANENANIKNKICILNGEISNLKRKTDQFKTENDQFKTEIDYLKLKIVTCEKNTHQYAERQDMYLEKIAKLEKENSSVKFELNKFQNLCLNYTITLGEYREKYLNNTLPDTKKRRVE